MKVVCLLLVATSVSAVSAQSDARSCMAGWLIGAGVSSSYETNLANVRATISFLQYANPHMLASFGIRNQQDQAKILDQATSSPKLTSSPCQNDGICSPTADGHTYECRCKAGFGGSRCQLDLCSGSPCANSGSCLPDDTSGFRCECAPGYTGATCKQSNHCQPNPCLNRGKCKNRVSDFKCTCPPTYFGKTCEQRWISRSDYSNFRSAISRDTTRINRSLRDLQVKVTDVESSMKQCRCNSSLEQLSVRLSQAETSVTRLTEGLKALKRKSMLADGWVASSTSGRECMYKRVDTPRQVGIDAARQACRNHHPDADLVSILNRAEDTFLNRFGWGAIGINDIQTEGIYKWFDGSPLSYTNWRKQTNEPNNAGLLGEDCAIRFGADYNYQWNDTPCSDPVRSICKACL